MADNRRLIGMMSDGDGNDSSGTRQTRWSINRALAIAEIHGGDAALDALQEVASDVRLAEYQPYWAARAALLAKTS